MRDQVKWFAEQMEWKLKENDHKGGWDECEFRYLFQRLYEEVHELWLAYNRVTPPTPDYEAIIPEAADVANFAMMIADKARQAERNNRNS